MEAVLRCENEVHVDALTVVDFTMLYVTGYMSDRWTFRKVMGLGKRKKKIPKEPSPGTQESRHNINITHIVIVRVNTLLNISIGSKVFFIQVLINQSRL